MSILAKDFTTELTENTETKRFEPQTDTAPTSRNSDERSLLSHGFTRMKHGFRQLFRYVSQCPLCPLWLKNVFLSRPVSTRMARSECGLLQDGRNPCLIRVNPWLKNLVMFGLGLALWPSSVASAAEMPVTFVRAGEKVRVAVPKAVDVPLVARGFGRVWAGPTKPAENSVEWEFPAVRVPIRLAVVPSADTSAAPVASVVVYPSEYDPGWDPKLQVFATADTPEWLKAWLTATRVPFAIAKADVPLPTPEDSKGAVLIVGRDTAGKTARDFGYSEAVRRNTLILDAAWFGPNADKRQRLATTDNLSPWGLEELSRWRLATPLEFSRHAEPWAGIANRKPWISGADYPLVEEVRSPASEGRTVLSYLPWAERLGDETTDAVFLEILKATARKAPTDWKLGREVRWVWPQATDVNARLRPVLSEVLRAVVQRDREDPRNPLALIDLRGKDLSSDNVANITWPKPDGPGDWLILGTDPRLPEFVRELPPARVGKPQPVRWVPDDALPSGSSTRVRLMELLTESGVSVGTLITPLPSLPPGEK